MTQAVCPMLFILVCTVLTSANVLWVCGAGKHSWYFVGDYLVVYKKNYLKNRKRERELFLSLAHCSNTAVAGVVLG